MKIIAIVLVVVGFSSAARSGPYLPSGWKPQGPAFNLPGEVKTLPQEPAVEIQVQPEGSDAFQEYGPPKDEQVLQDLTNQELPEISTERAFVVLDLARINENLIQEAVVEEKKEVEVVVQQETENSNSNIVSEVQETEIIAKEGGDVEVSEAVTEVQNIADALANLEKEINVQQVENTQEVVEVKTLEKITEPQDDAPEGFLEYGPPGFKEYGPPKYEAIQPLTVAKVTNEVVERIVPAISDVRRRRYSPKFRFVRRSHH